MALCAVGRAAFCARAPRGAASFVSRSQVAQAAMLWQGALDSFAHASRLVAARLSVGVEFALHEKIPSSSSLNTGQ